MRAASSGPVRTGLLAVLLVLLSGTFAFGEEPPEKRYLFEMTDQPWSKVFGYLTEITGKPFIGTNKPTGTFTFKGPAGKKYTVGEIVDIINEGLLSRERPQRFRLIQRERSFTIIDPDERRNPGLFPLTSLEELPNRGNSELVRVALRLKVLAAEDVAAEVEDKLGPDGSVSVVAVSNTLVLFGPAGDVRRVCKLLQDLEQARGREAERPGTGEPVLKTYMVPAGQADAVAKTLQELYKDNPKVRIAAVGKSIIVYATPEVHLQIGILLKGCGEDQLPPGAEKSVDTLSHKCLYIKASDAERFLRETLGDRKILAVSDERSNTITLIGPPDKIAQAGEILKRIDRGEREGRRSGPVVQMYKVRTGKAEVIARMLQEEYKDAPSIRIQACGADAVAVYAYPDDQADIAALILCPPSKPGPTAPSDR
jgi:type II secretory pathway component GspD/PulD (secretin)